jgi:hypothetical protein
MRRGSASKRDSQGRGSSAKKLRSISATKSHSPPVKDHRRDKKQSIISEGHYTNTTTDEIIDLHKNTFEEKLLK